MRRLDPGRDPHLHQRHRRCRQRDDRPPDRLDGQGPGRPPRPAARAGRGPRPSSPTPSRSSSASSRRRTTCRPVRDAATSSSTAETVPEGSVMLLIAGSANRDDRRFAGRRPLRHPPHAASTSPSATASTSAWAPPWPGSRAGSPWRRCSTRFPEWEVGHGPAPSWRRPRRSGAGRRSPCSPREFPAPGRRGHRHGGHGRGHRTPDRLGCDPGPRRCGRRAARPGGGDARRRRLRRRTPGGGRVAEGLGGLAGRRGGGTRPGVRRRPHGRAVAGAGRGRRRPAGRPPGNGAHARRVRLGGGRRWGRRLHRLDGRVDDRPGPRVRGPSGHHTHRGPAGAGRTGPGRRRRPGHRLRHRQARRTRSGSGPPRSPGVGAAHG